MINKTIKKVHFVIDAFDEKRLKVLTIILNL